MKITVIVGTEYRGVTHEIKDLFIKHLIKSGDEVKEFYLPKDGPDFCTGCKNCFNFGEDFCPHKDKIQVIWNSFMESEIIVFVYPTYVMNVPAQLKALEDHLAYRWMVHRPEPDIFGKKAVIISQTLGAAGFSLKEMKKFVSWIGISNVKSASIKLMEGIEWDKLSEKKKRSIEEKLKNLAFCTLSSSNPIGIVEKFKLFMCRKLRKMIIKEEGENLSFESKYWIDRKLV